MTFGIVLYISKTNHRENIDLEIQENTASNSNFWNGIET